MITFCGCTTVQASNAISTDQIINQILTEAAKRQELRREKLKVVTSRDKEEFVEFNVLYEYRFKPAIHYMKENEENMYKRQEEVSQYHIVVAFSYINSIIAHVLQQYNNILDEDFVTLIERLVNTPSVSLSIFLDNNRVSEHAFAEVLNDTVSDMINILNDMK